jgi:hypothetical protein
LKRQSELRDVNGSQQSSDHEDHSFSDNDSVPAQIPGP